MKLKRITFSGRLYSSHNNNETFRRILIRGLICMVLDISIALAISILLFYTFSGYAISPYQQPLPCNDESIGKPFKPNTVQTKHLLLISLGTPFLVICFVEALVFHYSHGQNKVANYFLTSTFLYLKYLFTFASCIFLMEYLKCTVGRLRPHFLSVCQPDWSRMNCTGREYIPASETYCMNPDARRIRAARTSFPSGHAAAAFHVLFFLLIYLPRMARITGISYLYQTRNVFLIICTCWTTFTAVTRVTDFWHYSTDVLGGIILAAVCVLPVFGWQWRNYDDVYLPRQLTKSRLHDE
ncbi:PAP2 family protein [Dictyocaulus viviparus]|uniref:PAP2 family protein n=1 Tax=Dictyocaulus viviparus TaxID=29172 RepID=A0A0D8YAE1_DICVI|nr:PAP2 family protein [Dictyocaulus viviparus]